MDTKDFKETVYTIQIDWDGGTVWLNNHASKEKFIVTQRDSKSIADAFKLIDAKNKGLF
jgi:hypothetical protein